jgi:hypothetical protein
MNIAHNIVKKQRSRGNDAHGSGQFGAKRGARSHNGLDIVAEYNEEIYSPIEGDLMREALPYPDDPSFRGILIKGVGNWEGYEIKMFYVIGLICGRVKPGSLVGRAQNLTEKYKGITNHVHIEVKHKGVYINPLDIYGQCF